jgi:histone H3/H4
MTTQELFEIITKIIAEPHNVITEHDKRRAIQVFLGFDDYLIDD